MGDDLIAFGLIRPQAGRVLFDNGGRQHRLRLPGPDADALGDGFGERAAAAAAARRAAGRVGGAGGGGAGGGRPFRLRAGLARGLSGGTRMRVSIAEALVTRITPADGRALRGVGRDRAAPAETTTSCGSAPRAG
jgi:hypothetical protein